MKKTIFVILIVAILAISLTACGGVGGGDVYSRLNEMVGYDYSTIKLEVATTMNGITLTNKYTGVSASNGTVVTYTVQTLAEVVENEDGSFSMSSEMIVTDRGSATVNNGKITELNGKAENIPVNEITSPSLNFNKTYFVSTVHTDNDGVKTIIGTILNDRIKDFTGNQNFDGKDMTFEVVYGENINSIVLNYTTNAGATVKVTYTFSK